MTLCAAASRARSLSHWRVGEVGDGQAVTVVLVGERDAVVRLRQELAERAEASPSARSRACTRAASAPQWPWAATCSAQVIGSGETVWIENPRL